MATENFSVRTIIILSRCTKMSRRSNKITNYFQITKNVEFVDVPVYVEENTTDNFYEECLDRQIDRNKCNKDCEIRKLELKNRLQHEKEKLANLEKALSSCLFMIDIKNDKIAKLLEKSQSQSTSAAANIIQPVSNSPSNTTKNLSKPISPKSLSHTATELFQSYANDFTANQLAQLRSFGKEMRHDSSFILKLMRFLYEDDITALKGIQKNYSFSHF